MAAIASSKPKSDDDQIAEAEGRVDEALAKVEELKAKLAEKKRLAAEEANKKLAAKSLQQIKDDAAKLGYDPDSLGSYSNPFNATVLEDRRQLVVVAQLGPGFACRCELERNYEDSFILTL